MGSKVFVLLALLLTTVVLLFSLEVAARDMDDTSINKETVETASNRVDDAKHGGGYGGYPGGGYGGGGGGYGGGGGGYGGGGGGYGGGRCPYGCCRGGGGGYYGRRCWRCCAYPGEKPDTVGTRTEPQN